MTTVVLLSGGMDSVAMAYGMRRSADHLVCVFANYGQRLLDREYECAERTAAVLQAELALLDIPMVPGSSLTGDKPVPNSGAHDAAHLDDFIPNRNMILLAHATAIAVQRGARRACIGTHSGSASLFPDCRPAFIDAATACARIGNDGLIDEGFRIEAPFARWSKADIVRSGEVWGVPWADTWSCYKGGARHCGTCAPCTSRRLAFIEAGVEDPTQYDDDDELVAT